MRCQVNIILHLDSTSNLGMLTIHAVGTWCLAAPVWPKIWILGPLERRLPQVCGLQVQLTCTVSWLLAMLGALILPMHFLNFCHFRRSTFVMCSTDSIWYQTVFVDQLPYYLSEQSITLYNNNNKQLCVCYVIILIFVISIFHNTFCHLVKEGKNRLYRIKIMCLWSCYSFSHGSHIVLSTFITSGNSRRSPS